MITVEKAFQLKDNLAVKMACPFERQVDKEMLQNFTHISQDSSSLHCAELDDAIVPGNLLISLLPAMLQSGMKVSNFEQCKTVTIENIRFRRSVYLEQSLTLHFQILSVKKIGENCFVSTELILRLSSDGSTVMTAGQTDCFIG